MFGELSFPLPRGCAQMLHIEKKKNMFVIAFILQTQFFFSAAQFHQY